MALDPSGLNSYAVVANCTRSLGRLAEAKTWWEEIGRLIQGYQGHHSQLYSIALLQGDTAEAQRQLEWAKGKSQEATFMSYLRQQEAQAGQLASARARDRQVAIAAGRKPAESSSAHAWNLLLAGRLGPAKDEAGAVLKEFPEDRAQTVTAAFVLALSGEEAEAGKLAGALEAGAIVTLHAERSRIRILPLGGR